MTGIPRGALCFDRLVNLWCEIRGGVRLPVVVAALDGGETSSGAVEGRNFCYSATLVRLTGEGIDLDLSHTCMWAKFHAWHPGVDRFLIEGHVRVPELRLLHLIFFFF
jgi:hypothetical protein